MVSSTTLLLPLILYLSFFSSFFISPSQSHNKVSLNLYYESLCPYSADFITTSLPKIFTDNLLSIVDLRLVPWGNADIIKGNKTFNCQHGPHECLLNTVEACVIYLLPDPGKHFPFINCVEHMVHKNRYKKWKSCIRKLLLDPNPIINCYRGEIGKQLELKYANETNALQPPYKFVPWIVVNGVPLKEDYENFLSYVCKAYQGPNKPKNCTQASFLRTVREVGAMPKHSVSYKKRVMPTLKLIQ
ncbi:gamma-interferon-responsive lysosomal thiol protein-like, partial [Lotus japonicus]|uniref:gamma-interferon-responsive lysosomal thiol protein-like n=1 Tax=Lotus japonicus TaxID=34305 RepID=UPI0025887695